MSLSKPTGNFIELNDHCAIAVRIAAANTPLLIEEVREIALHNRVEAAEAVRQMFGVKEGAEPVPVACALRPAERFFHLASAAEARQHATSAAVRAAVSALPLAGDAPCEITSVLAQTGRAVGSVAGSRWFAAGARAESIQAALGTLTEWNLTPARIESATIGFLGASRAALSGTKGAEPLLVWDPAEGYSNLFVVTPGGIEGARRVGFGFEIVFEALLAEIQLKFKGAAVRLFFNERYDFSEAGPKIAARVAAKLQPEVVALATECGRPSVSFVCAGVPAKQAWFVQALSSALQLAPWTPNLNAWCAENSLSFANDEIKSGLAVSALGALGLLSTAGQSGAIAWHPLWLGGTSEPAGQSPAAEVRPNETTAPAAAVTTNSDANDTSPAAKPAEGARKPIPVAAPKIAAASTEVGRVVEAGAAGAGTPTASSGVTGTVEAARPVPKRPIPPPTFPGPLKKKPSSLLTQALIKAETDQAVAPKDGGASKPPAATPPGKAAPAGDNKQRSAPTSTIATAVAPAQPVASRKRSSSKGLWIGGAIAGIAAIGAGVFFVMSSAQEQKALALREKQAAEARAAADAEARRIAEAKAQEEAEARRQAEQLARQQEAAAQAARQKAEEEARLRQAEVERLLNARGSLVIKTEPSGATVTLGNLAPRTTPAIIHDLRLGQYKAEISHPGFDSVQLDVDIRTEGVTDMGTILLRPHTGTLVIESEPAGLNYTVRPEGISFSEDGSRRWAGTTPATLTDLPTESYVVSIERAGWPVASEIVAIEKGATARVSHAFSGGIVNLTSVPAGARVLRDGEPIGATPLTLPAIPPGNVTYTLELPDHHPSTISGTVEAGRTLDLSVALVPFQSVARSGEVDVPPKPVRMVQPVLDDASAYVGQKVVISIVVDVDGRPRDWRIEEAPTAALADQCIEALAQWRFEPGRVKGEPAKVRISVPFVIR